jgi:hypothetical protein
MFRPFIFGVVLLAAGSLGAQTISASAAPAPADPAQQVGQRTPQLKTVQPDPVDAKIEQALRERDAIIRNLLERVQELETRLNAPSVAASGRAVAGTTIAAPPPNSLATMPPMTKPSVMLRPHWIRLY